MTRLYYSIADPYPAYRVDISELFGVELARLGLDIEWFMMGHVDGVARYGADQPVRLPRRISACWPGVRIANRLLAWGSDALAVLGAAWRRDVDAVQCRDKFFVALVAAVACRLVGKPFFYWCSYPYPEHHLDEGRRRAGWRGALQRLKGHAEFLLLYRVVMPLATHVFVQSAQMRQDIAGYGLDRARMTPVPMGVPVRLMDRPAALSVPVVPDRVVYVGTLVAMRRLSVLIECFALVAKARPDAQLLLVGDGEFPHERQDLERLAQGLGLQGRVTFTGFVPIEQAWAYAASAAVCVSPIHASRVLNAGSPTKLVEYLALGRPVVCNDHPEQAAIIAATQAGHCVPWSAPAFAEAILDILDHPGRFEAGVQQGRRWVQQHRTYPAIAADVMAIYRRFLG